MTTHPSAACDCPRRLDPLKEVSPMELQSLCLWCGKQRHPTRVAALASSRRQRRRDARSTPRLRAYRCPAGLGWHLTSRRPRRPPDRRPGRRPAAPLQATRRRD